jgi:hypothetical protein
VAKSPLVYFIMSDFEFLQGIKPQVLSIIPSRINRFDVLRVFSFSRLNDEGGENINSAVIWTGESKNTKFVFSLPVKFLPFKGHRRKPRLARVNDSSKKTLMSLWSLDDIH